jgi:hypothetical protein
MAYRNFEGDRKRVSYEVTFGGYMRFGIGSMLPSLIACAALSFATASAWAQEKMKYSYSGKPESSKFTQTHAIDVGDVPGHQLRVGQLQSKYGADAPEFAGIKVVESKNTLTTDYTDGKVGYSSTRSQAWQTATSCISAWKASRIPS